MKFSLITSSFVLLFGTLVSSSPGYETAVNTQTPTNGYSSITTSNCDKPSRKQRYLKRFKRRCSKISDCNTRCLVKKNKTACKEYAKKFRASRRHRKGGRRSANRKLRRKEFRSFCKKNSQCNTDCFIDKDKSACKAHRRAFRKQHRMKYSS
ncbi:hypothetical protein AYI69_g10814 [Smittium culicis]|uniref:Uncharacterized protein n=1 Tax=Smittium culicis TaxID=133412 RepID=A0A1R1X3A0_9FUNG|nr:hypothetical protein AYI69_g10814 [Smittium culicis]